MYMPRITVTTNRRHQKNVKSSEKYLYIIIMSFSFGKINTQSKKSILKVKVTDQFVLAEFTQSDTQPKVSILVDQFYTTEQLSSIELFLKAAGLRNYRIMLAANSKEISPSYVKDTLKEPIVKFYSNNRSAYETVIEKDDIILAAGASVYAVTGTDNIYTTDMHDIMFSPSKIAVNGHWVYVIDSFSDIFAAGFRSGPVDSYKTKIVQFRLKDILSIGKIAPPTKTRVRKIKISNEEFPAWVEEILSKKYTHMAADTETSGFDFMWDRVGDITMSFDGYTGYHVYFSEDKIELLNKLFLNHKLIGANFKFDAKMLWGAGLSKDIVWQEDVIKLGHTLNETRRNSLKTLSYLYTANGGYDKPLDEYKEKVKVESYIDDIPDDLRISYAIMDAIQTYNIWKKITKHMQKIDEKYPNERYPQHTLQSYYRNIRMPIDNMYAHLEYEGVYINKDENELGRQEIIQAQHDMQIQLYDLLGLKVPLDMKGNFNHKASHIFDSPTELGRHLQTLQWEDLGITKNGVLATGDYQLERWAKTHKAAKVLQRYRSSKTILNAFIGNKEETKGWSQYFHHHKDGSIRMHPTFNTMGADTGRSKCRNPNMQNPPAHGEFASNATRMICTKDDEKYYMVTVDYSALQLRLATIDSGDKTLRKVFSSEDADMHSLTGWNIIRNRKFDVEIIEVEEDGQKLSLLAGQLVSVIRDGLKQEVFAGDLLETDKLV